MLLCFILITYITNNILTRLLYNVISIMVFLLLHKLYIIMNSSFMWMNSNYVMYDSPIYFVFYMVFYNKADSVEVTCLLASKKRFVLYNVAIENCQSVHAVYLAAP